MKILLPGRVQTDGRFLWNNAALSLIWMKPVWWHMQGYSKKVELRPTFASRQCDVIWQGTALANQIFAKLKFLLD